MKNVLKLVLFLLLITIQMSCERDDICVDDITPHLIIRFYNYEIPDELRTVMDLKVNIEGIEGDYTNETIGTFTDSIAVPLRVDQNNTSIVLTLMGNELAGTEDNPDTISLVYSQQDLFVSRSCGYKTIYNNAEVTVKEDGDNWIKELETKTETFDIIDEKAAHVKIYH